MADFGKPCSNGLCCGRAEKGILRYQISCTLFVTFNWCFLPRDFTIVKILKRIVKKGCLLTDSIHIMLIFLDMANLYQCITITTLLLEIKLKTSTVWAEVLDYYILLLRFHLSLLYQLGTIIMVLPDQCMPFIHRNLFGTIINYSLYQLAAPKTRDVRE